MTRPDRPAAVFLLALAVRLAWLAANGVSEAALFHPDSPIFVEIARAAGWWQGTEERMPLYPIFLHLHFALFGADAYAAPVVTQLVADAFACVAVAATAETLRVGAGRWAGLFAALNPTQIALASCLLGDSLFVACLAFAFLALARWQAGGGDRTALAAGIWLALALLNRAVVWPFLPVLAVLMLAGGGFASRAWRGAAVVAGCVALAAAPVVARNWVESGRPALSAQGGMHMALWWYPLAREAADGTPYARTAAEVAAEFAARGGGAGAGRFADEAVYSALAREGLASVGVAGIAKAWALGMAINLASPATLMIPRVMALPRTGFYATPGASPLDKVVNFVASSSSGPYLAWLAAGAALEWPVRLAALAGLFLALRRRETRAAGIFALLWIGYVLAVQGPVASAKYRLPAEPVAMVLAGLALSARDRSRSGGA